MPLPSGVYEGLRELQDRLARVMPPTPEEYSSTLADDTECPGFLVIEASPSCVWRLCLPPKMPMVPHSCGYMGHTERRAFIRRATALPRLSWGSVEKERLPAPPTGVRLWHPTERAQVMLFHARHDLEELFAGDTAARMMIPCVLDRRAHRPTALLETRHGALAHRDGLRLLALRSPYLAKLCKEYARMARGLYGLSAAEFECLARLSVRHHAADARQKGLLMLLTGGGFYDGGPALHVMVGQASVAHDMTPVLPADVGATSCDESVRMIVAEGVMIVLDGHARARYAHGYYPADDEHAGGKEDFYTLEWSLDCMRRTRTIGSVRALGWLVMYTPVLRRHCLQLGAPRTTPPDDGAAMEQRADMWPINCPAYQLIAQIRARLQVRESYLLSQPAVGENSPSRSMAE